MNKGIEIATGDIIGILNSDDFYIDEFVIEKVINRFKEKNIDSVYADLVYVKHENLDKVVRYYDSSKIHPSKLKSSSSNFKSSCSAFNLLFPYSSLGSQSVSSL
jgi:glycosyltransferase involved in cell wall biosynthesis